MFPQSSINGAGLGAGIVNSHGASGAGHGGFGGKGNMQEIRGSFYNSLKQPSQFGSSGGGLKTAGGGVLRVECHSFKLDGDIKVDGQSGRAVLGSPNGGASGGSVWIDCKTLEGSGSISSNGGGGDTLSGGGSGGRIALHFAERNTFGGILVAFGGDSAHESGAAGTIVIANSKTGESNLTISNQGRKPSSARIKDFSRLSTDAARTWVPASNDGNRALYASDVIGLSRTDYYTEYSFNVFKLGGSSHVAFEQNKQGVSSVIILRQLISTYEGQSFGYLHTLARQLIIIKQSDLYVPANLQVYPNGVFQLPDKVIFHNNDLYLEGALIGVRELTVSSGELRVSLKARISFYLSGGSGFDLIKLSIFPGGVIVGPSTSMNLFKIKAGILDMQAGGTISGRSLDIEAQTMAIRDSAAISVDYGGFPKMRGEGAGPTDSRGKESCGGSHAGFGACPSSLSHAAPYGNMFQPGKAGSGGGGISAVTGGGEGGGIIRIFTVELSLDGTISAR